MDYNFFSEIASKLPVKDPVTDKKLQQKDREYQIQIDKLNTEIERLKQENNTLKVKFELLESVIEKLGHSK